MNVVKGLPPQSPAARAANKAARVVEIPHGLTRLGGSGDLLTTGETNAYSKPRMIESDKA